ncbi:helix-turn-helix transcriptional regulator [Chloroflexota bacterium]
MIGNKLREWRHKLGFTQQELTQAAGVSIATTVLIERYGHLPSEDVRQRLSRALGVSEGVIWPDVVVVSDGN